MSRDKKARAAEQRIERHASAEVFADTEDPRKRRVLIQSAKRWAKNTANEYVPWSKELRNGEQNLRIISAACNFQAERGAGRWGIYDDGFNTLRGRYSIKIQQNISGTWTDLALPMVDQRVVDEQESEGTWAWDFLTPGVGQMEARFRQRLGSSKWVYRFRNVQAMNGQFRAAFDVSLLNPPEEIYTGHLKTGEVSSVTWRYGLGDTLRYNFTDLHRTSLYGSHRLGPSGLQVVTAPFNLAPGENQIIDPTMTQDAGYGADVSSGGTKAPDDGDDFCGRSADIYRCAYRFAFSGITAADTVDSGTFQTAVLSVSGATSSTWELSSYNSDGLADPEADSGANMYLRCNPGDPWTTGITAYRTTGSKTENLPAQALADIAAALDASATTFSIAVREEGEAAGGTHRTAFDEFNGSDAPTLSIIYTTPGGSELLPKIQHHGAFL